MKFSEYIQKQGDEFRRAGDGYEALSDTSKACIDYAVQRYLDEYAAKQQAIAFARFVNINYDQHGDNYVSKNITDNEVYFTDELYSKFIEQQNKP